MKKVLALYLVLILCLTLTTPVFAEGPVRGGSITVAKTNKLTSFNPATTSSRNEDGYIYYMIFDTLIGYDATGAFAPKLAKSWETSEDGLTLTLKLQEGVTFHDGTPFNAEAVKANLDWACDEETGHVYKVSELGNIASVEVIDELTVAIHLSQPDAALLSVFTNICGLMLSPASLESGDIITNACGTGPFKLKEYVQGDHVTLVRNENYWVKGEDGQSLPYLDEVVFRLMSDDSVKTVNLQTGDIDMVDYHSSANSIMKCMKEENLTTVMTNNRQTYFMCFNLNDERLSNPLIRQAVSFAVNRQEIMEVCLEGYGVVEAFDATPDQWFYSDYTPYTFDPAKAKELLAEAGYPDGITIKLSFIAREPDATMCQLIQEQVKESGITLELEPLERLAWIDLIKTNRAGEMGIGVIAIQGLDPNQQYNSTLAYCDPKHVTEIQELLLSAKTVSDIEERTAILHEYQRQFLDNALYVILGQYPRYVSYANNIMGIVFNPNGTFDLSAAYIQK